MKDKKTSPEHKPVNPTVASRGVPGFHNKIEPGDGKPLAGMELDADTDPDRVDTGTGDQPGNTNGSRFSTPPPAQEGLG
ncbi:MAG: hypothetical protein ABI432_07205 [Flavobacteriales bacterium]